MDFLEDGEIVVLEEVLRLLLEKVAEEEGVVVDGETVAFAGEFDGTLRRPARWRTP